jgi:hypothetical protein
MTPGELIGIPAAIEVGETPGDGEHNLFVRTADATRDQLEKACNLAEKAVIQIAKDMARLMKAAGQLAYWHMVGNLARYLLPLMAEKPDAKIGDYLQASHRE